MCIIIPVHKSNISDDEIKSLLACKMCLVKYDCYLVYPNGTEVSRYLELHNSLLLKPVDAVWLSSIENYNKMKTSLSFYKMFQDYTYMLTYELDSYIFSDNWDAAHVFNFDYIGAPWFEGFLMAEENANFISGGNSGFSIRNIQSCINALKAMKKYRFHWLFYKFIISRIPKVSFHLNRLTKKRYEVFLNGHTGFYFSEMFINEDLVWSKIIPRLFPSFNIAPSQTAMKFSFEANPAKLLYLNNGKLPLGCHAWPKFKSFWKEYIDIKDFV